MNNNLLIVGAGVYAVVAYEIAVDMGCFERIAFVDDAKESTPTGSDVIGKINDIANLSSEYNQIIVAIGNPEIRMSLLEKIKNETPCVIVTLVSPKAYVSPTAQVCDGCIIEPMAVVHTGCVIGEGCIISAGAVVNHASECCSGVHIDCNATVAGYSVVPENVKVHSSAVYESKK